MYTRHKIILLCSALGVFVLMLITKIDFTPIAASGLDIIAICTAVYLAVYPAIQGNRKLFENLQKQDNRKRDKTEMEVLNRYIIAGLIIGLISIVAFCSILIVNDNCQTISYLKKHKTMVPLWRYLLSSSCYALFVADLVQIIWIGLFIVRRVSNNA